MKVYADANIYITYLLGQRGEEKCDYFFKKSIECHFSIVCSKTTFAEIVMICGEEAKILLQNHVDEFRGARKLEIVQRLEEDMEVAMTKGKESGLGFNDILHKILAERHADVFITEDKRLFEFSKKRCESERYG